jgi:hypothetical protein
LGIIFVGGGDEDFPNVKSHAIQIVLKGVNRCRFPEDKLFIEQDDDVNLAFAAMQTSNEGPKSVRRREHLV